MTAYLPGVLGTALGARPMLDNPSADFSDTTWWITGLKILLIFVYLLLSVVVVIWFERRIVGFLQQRPGPNRFGPGGVFQTLADGFKLVWKEVIIPRRADKVVYLLAPTIAGSTAFISFAIIPMAGDVGFLGHRTPLQVTDTPVAVLLVMAVASISAYGVLLAGWSSGSIYPLLGGLRASAQVISYEIAMGLSLVTVFLYSGSMSTSQIVSGQYSQWYIVPLAFSFVIYVITMFGETNRLPFDLAEGEGEIVAGHHTEYSGMRFGMFFLGEYVNMFTVAGLATTMFLGGWQAPPGIAAIGNGMFNNGWWGFLWFTIKVWMFMFTFVWVRGTLPRTRYDQFMRFGWKFLIPASLLLVLAVAFLRAATLGYMGESQIELMGRSWMRAVLFVVSAIILLILIAYWVWASRDDAKVERMSRQTSVPAEVDPYAGGYPVPPLPGQRLREPSRARVVAAASTQTVDSTSTTVPLSKETDRG